MAEPMKPSDPAYWMLVRGRKEQNGEIENTGWVTKSNGVYNEDCYICNDHEFALMGLPLCYPCVVCGAHVPADDVECDNGHDSSTPPNYSDEQGELDLGLDDSDDFPVRSEDD